MTFRVIVPERLSELRGKRSREVIAHELRRRGHGTDAKAIWRWEKGHNTPSARVLSDYAAVLGCTVDELFGDDEDEEAAPEMREAFDLFVALMSRINAKERVSQ